MTFKGIAGDMNELEFVYFHPAYHMTLTFVRVFTNVKDANGYEAIFDAVFDDAKRLTGRRSMWRHIDESGWSYILADFDSAQAMGLGQYLHKLDKTRSPTQHLQHVLVTCITHFKRNIAARKFPSEIRDLFWSIPTLRSQNAVEKIFLKLRDLGQKSVDDLVQFYEKPWVLSSLSPAYTKVPLEIFNTLTRSTNAGESAHANANRMGKRNSLLAAIFKYV